MTYSFIVCYRDREQHLRILAPRLNEMFYENEAEIIVVEQADNDRFLRGQLFNAGAQIAKGDVLVFHDVDHYPTFCTYDLGGADVVSPIRRVTFVTNDLRSKPLDQVPSGYRHFKDEVDADFFGGVTVFGREAFFDINGFNSLYKGWGLEDADLRERINHYHLTWRRGDASFLALDHPDSNPGLQDGDFQGNQMMFARWPDYLWAGVNVQHQTMTEIAPPYHGSLAAVTRWVQVTNVHTVTYAEDDA